MKNPHAIQRQCVRAPVENKALFCLSRAMWLVSIVAEKGL